MTVFSSTDIGRVRSSNQDAVASGEFAGGCWGVVCDGMGGANGGDVASSTAVDIIRRTFMDKLRCDMAGSQVRQLIEEAVNNANAAILERSQKDVSLFGMGTTVVCAVVIGDTFYIAHAGDSRGYIIGENRISCITKDHSMVQELVDLGRLTVEEARNHPRKNVITRALGVYPEISVDHTEGSVDAEDIILLCSDGLSNCVDDAELQAIVRELPMEKLCDALIEAANNNGGTDNITALVIGK